MGPYVPTRPDPGYVALAVGCLVSIGWWLIQKGGEANSIGARVFGSLLIVLGLYYVVRYWLACRRDQEN